MFAPSASIAVFQAIQVIMRPYTLAFLLVAAVLLSACGIKGNLYMPEIPSAKPEPKQAPDDTKPPAANPA
jgi:predicted small lipoprotein YifL